MMEKWSAQDYIGQRFNNHYVLYTHSRDSDTLVESNWRSIIKYLDEKKAVYIIARFSHWAVGWIEQILIKESEKESVDIGNDIIMQLRNYPVFDDDDYRSLQDEKANILLDEIMADIRDLEPGDALGWGCHITPTMSREEIYDAILDYGMIEQ
jgi:hypothetical protein